MAQGRPLLRPLLAWPVAAVALAGAVTACFLLSPFLGGRRAFWILAPRYVRFAAACFGITRSLGGWERLPEDLRLGRRPMVLVGNHTSLFDPPLVISTLPCEPVFVAKRELGRVPFLGWVIWLAGFIFIDRGNRQEARRSLARAADRIREGQSVIAFPEGTRSRDGSLLPFKKGAFGLAREAGVAVVPFAIQGGPDVLPRGTWRVRGAAYRITVGAPLDPAEFEDLDALREAAREAVQALLSSRP